MNFSAICPGTVSVIQGNIGVSPSFTIAAMAEYSMSHISAKAGSDVNDISKQLLILEEEWKKKILV